MPEVRQLSVLLKEGDYFSFVLLSRASLCCLIDAREEKKNLQMFGQDLNFETKLSHLVRRRSG